MIPTPRAAVRDLVSYRPGKGAVDRPRAADALPPLRLASNENQLPPPQWLLDAISAAAQEANRYPDHLALALRARIGEWLAIDEARIAIGCGSVGLLQQVWLAYVDPGDRIVLPWRSFEVYPVYSSLTAADAVFVPLGSDFAFDVDAVLAACEPGARMLVLASPNNPTGAALRFGEIERILATIDPSTVVVLDEAYREYTDPALGDPLPDLVDAYGNLIVLRTFSKAYGLAGLRVGYAVAEPEVVAALDRCLFPFAVSGVAQAAALAAVDHAESAWAEAAVVRTERERVAAVLRGDGWVIPPSEANFVYLPLGDRTEAIYLALEDEGVLTRPFMGEGIRITIGQAAENDRLLAAMARVGPPIAG